MSQRVVVPMFSLLLCGVMLLPARGTAQPMLERRLDSLFVIASSGEVRFRDQNKPAMDSIANYGVQAVPFLIDKFKTKSVRERWTVIWTLQRIGSPAVPLLIEALGQDDFMIVQRVCWALGELKDSSAVLALVDISSHLRWQVRERAITALGKIGDSRAETTVMHSLGDSSEQVRKSAAVASGRLAINTAVRQLVHQLGDSFYGARWTAAEALLKLDTTTVVSALVDSLDSSRVLVGDLACWVLGQLATDEALNLLNRQTFSDDPYRRAHAAVAIVSADPLDNCGFVRNLLSRETDRLVRLKIRSAVTAAADTL